MTFQTLLDTEGVKTLIDDPNDPILEAEISLKSRVERNACISQIRHECKLQAWPIGDLQIGLRGPKSGFLKLRSFGTN